MNPAIIILGKKARQFLYQPEEGAEQNTAVELGDSIRFQCRLREPILTLKVVDDKPPFPLIPITVVRIAGDLDAYYLVTCRADYNNFAEAAVQSNNDPTTIHTLAIRWLPVGAEEQPITMLNNILPAILQDNEPPAE